MEFIRTYDTFNHSTRRKRIIAIHPEIQELFGHEPMTKYIASILVILQLVLSVIIKSQKLYIKCVVLYFFSASISQALFLVNHEASHNLIFKKCKHNIFFGMFVNLPAIFPYSAKFREYHLDHHNFMGKVGYDTDIPSHFETYILSSVIGRMLWLSLQIIMYAVRPIFIAPKAIDRYTIINTTVQLGFDLLFYFLFGIEPIVFLLLSLIIAGGLHPTSGHFIAEHTLFDSDNCDIDTRSYYGILNKITFNVGYHNEHHDFIYIPWSKLPIVKEMAGEFYKLPECKSWIFTLFQFCFYNPIRILRT
jgi:sphingolipid delta-4 desaturase